MSRYHFDDQETVPDVLPALRDPYEWRYSLPALAWCVFEPEADRVRAFVAQEILDGTPAAQDAEVARLAEAFG